MSHSGSCVGKGTPRYVDRQKVTINVSQIKETARPGAIKKGFLVEENCDCTQDSSVLHRIPFPVQWSSLIFLFCPHLPGRFPSTFIAQRRKWASLLATVAWGIAPTLRIFEPGQRTRGRLCGRQVIHNHLGGGRSQALLYALLLRDL